MSSNFGYVVVLVMFMVVAQVFVYVLWFFMVLAQLLKKTLFFIVLFGVSLVFFCFSLVFFVCLNYLCLLRAYVHGFIGFIMAILGSHLVLDCSSMVLAMLYCFLSPAHSGEGGGSSPETDAPGLQKASK